MNKQTLPSLLPKSSLFILIFTVFFGLAFTQNGLSQQTKSIATQTNMWLMYFGNHSLSQKWNLHTEYQWRRHDWLKDWQQSLLRLGADYKLTGDHSVSAGYAWVHSYPYGSQPIAFAFDEHRIWQQLILQHQYKRIYFHHRYRLEQRFLENITASPDNEPIQDGYNFRNRGRYRLMISIPINRREMADKTLFVAAYNEVFLGFGKGIRANILDQNRLYFALGYRFNNKMNVQLGYLNHYIIKADGWHHERNHTLQTGITYNLDLKNLFSS